MKTYNLSEIAKEYATKNQCGLPLTPEQLLNSVVVYVNEEVTDLASNSFPFTTEEKESVFNSTSVTYSVNTVTTEYTSEVNGNKFTVKQPFGARENGGLTCGVNESGTAMEVGIDMAGSDNDYVLTSVNGKPTWKANVQLYNHVISLNTDTCYVYLTIVSNSPNQYTFSDIAAYISGKKYPCSGVWFDNLTRAAITITSISLKGIRISFGPSLTNDLYLDTTTVIDFPVKIL